MLDIPGRKYGNTISRHFSKEEGDVRRVCRRTGHSLAYRIVETMFTKEVHRFYRAWYDQIKSAPMAVYVLEVILYYVPHNAVALCHRCFLNSNSNSSWDFH